MTHYLKGQARNGSDALNTITRKPAAGEYLTPAADSDITIYNPLEVAEELVVDALNRGALLCQGETITDKEKAALLDFTGRYGLLGFMSAIPLNGGFMVYPHVFFGRNGFFDADYMETKDYLQIFQPFGSKQGQPKTGFTIYLVRAQGVWQDEGTAGTGTRENGPQSVKDPQGCVSLAGFCCL